MQAATESGAKVLLVDSEHNAIYQVRRNDYQGRLNAHGIESIVLTASGCPFSTPIWPDCRHHPRAGGEASQLEHGAENFGGFRHHDE